MPSPSTRPLAPDAPELLRALDREARAHPLARKLIVAPTAGAGRELLRSLARARGGWTGFEVTTVRPLAVQIAVEWIASEGVRVIDAFEEEARLDEALDQTLDPRHGDDEVMQAFGDLAQGSGFRRGLRDALKALRLTGIAPADVARARFEDVHKQRLLETVLDRYESALSKARATDVAGVLDRAARALDRGSQLPASRVLLLPGLGLRGRAGRFVQALEAHGAIRLTTDPVRGLAVPSGLLHAEPPDSGADATPTRGPAPAGAPDAAPTDAFAGLPLFDQVQPPAPPSGSEPAAAPPRVEFFRAAGVHEELREVLRRVTQSGHRWDEVEIVTPDPGFYGPTLQTLCARLGIDTTFAVGLPVARTRPGRAVSAWLRWISDDGPAPVLRRLLQTSDLVAPGRRPADSPYLARTLRRLRIGWGRERYRPLIAAALARVQAGDTPNRRRSSAEDEEARRAREVRDLQSLDRLVRELLATTPDPRGTTSPADVARSLITFLSFVPAESEVDRSAHERLSRLLDRIAHTLVRPTRFSAAVATVREHLEIRVPAPRVEGKAPWLADGGALHLSDLEHGGLSGRPLLFIVGMDAGRFPGGNRQDPFLLDRERRSLSGDLPVTEDRVSEQHFRLAALLSRVRARLTVSYPAWEASEARLLQPSSVLLTLFRRREGDPSLGYADLERHLDAPASRIPRASSALDNDDIWLGALADGSRLYDGRTALRARHAALDAGLGAVERTREIDASPQVGILPITPERAERLDPRSPTGPRLSASGLESLGACPLRYFYARVLRVHPPDEPEFDLERWLPPAERGSLLHDVFQASIERARADQLEIGTDAFRTSAMRILDEEVTRMRSTLPPPSESVFRGEVRVLEDDVRSFCSQLADEGTQVAHVLATELGLGDDEPVSLDLPGGGTVRIRGRVDRIDRTPEGLRIIDYKTGRAWGHGDAEGTYHGGRRLQHVLYARAVEAEMPDEPPVSEVAYDFPTVKGENQSHGYPAARLADGLGLIAELVKLPAAARFPATDDPSDCRFCDYRAVCRFGSIDDGDGNDSAPRVEWTRARFAEGHPDVLTLRSVRTHERD